MLYSVDMEVSVGGPKRISSSEMIGEVDQFEGTILEHIEDATVIRLLPVFVVRVVFFTRMSLINF